MDFESDQSVIYHEDIYEYDEEPEQTIDELLITLVEFFPIIYDKQLASYKDQGQKENVWKQIATTLSLPVETCVASWDRLRSKYMRERRAATSGPASGSAYKHKAVWTYFQAMSFLDKFIINRRTFKNPHYFKEVTNLTTTSCATDMPPPLNVLAIMQAKINKLNLPTMLTVPPMSTMPTTTNQVFPEPGTYNIQYHNDHDYLSSIPSTSSSIPSTSSSIPSTSSSIPSTSNSNYHKYFSPIVPPKPPKPTNYPPDNFHVKKKEKSSELQAFLTEQSQALKSLVDERKKIVDNAPIAGSFSNDTKHFLNYIGTLVESIDDEKRKRELQRKITTLTLEYAE